jgi:hypothetical protein
MLDSQPKSVDCSKQALPSVSSLLQLIGMADHTDKFSPNVHSQVTIEPVMHFRNDHSFVSEGPPQVIISKRKHSFDDIDTVPGAKRVKCDNSLRHVHSANCALNSATGEDSCESLSPSSPVSCSSDGTDKVFACTLPNCNRTFHRKSDLRTHLRTHTGDRPYFCPFEGCHKRFTTCSNLRRHERIHTGEKPYVCQVPGCLKAFTQLSHLKRHNITHERKRV